ncbi:hypothetical protein SDC9_83420 [bioreactor metagenome]|uniref:Uncharacterized protein n=1 Tax=bioreactor metagenome TaxID=1076179 RepID=A0A644Z847_9ZZZZ
MVFASGDMPRGADDVGDRIGETPRQPCADEDAGREGDGARDEQQAVERG